MRLPPFPFPSLPTPTHRLRIRLLSLSLPTTLFFSTSSATTMSSPTTNPPSSSSSSSFPKTPYTPNSPNGPFPYPPSDFLRADESPDTDFYAAPRFVTHIDDHAIALLKRYYAETLPRKGRVLDLCSSWVSHFPRELEEAAAKGTTKQKNAEKGGLLLSSSSSSAQQRGGETQTQEQDHNDDDTLQILALGLNAAELSANPLLSTSTTILQDLNKNPTLPASLHPLHATVCVVSIDYLTSPLAVLSSLRERTIQGGSVHLVVSNRCFPTKAVGRWLRSSEEERVKMVGDYLWWSGWRGVEVVGVCDGRRREGEGEEREEGKGIGGGLAGLMRGMFGGGGGGVDPLWVVRAVKVAQGEEGIGQESKREEEKSEL